MLTAEEMNMASMRAAGATLQTIANHEGKDVSTISRRMSKSEIQDYITEIKEQMMSTTLKKSVENIQYAVNQYKTTDDKQVKEHGARFSERIAESVGILPSRTPSLTINGDVQVTPIIAQIIQQFGRSLASSDDVIEAEPSNK